MNSPQRHSPEFYEVPAGVILTPRAAYLIDRWTNVGRLRQRVMTRDPELYSVLVAMRKAAMTFEASSEVVPKRGSVNSDAAELASLLSSRQAAELLNVTPRAVLKAIGRGTLPAVRVGRKWRIERSDLTQYRDDRRSGGETIR